MIQPKQRIPILSILVLVAALASPAAATVVDFEDLAEGPAGLPFTHAGITYHDLNNVSGVFPDGSTFGPQDGHQCIVENAALFWNDFPGWGSPVNVLTFGTAYVEGDNFSIGALATVTMDFAVPAAGISLDIGFYENGPWGGIVYHLDALRFGQVVGSDSFTIIGESDRDNPAAATLAIPDVVFDQLHLYATYGGDYSMPRGMIDDIAFDQAVATEPASWTAVKDLFR
jgi:hypothetical protein